MGLSGADRSTKAGWTILLLASILPWLLLAKQPWLAAAVPLGGAVLTAVHLAYPRRLPVWPIPVAVAIVGVVAVRSGALPEESASSWRIKALLVVWTALLPIATRWPSALRVVSINLVVGVATLLVAEAVIRIADVSNPSTGRRSLREDSRGDPPALSFMQRGTDRPIRRTVDQPTTYSSTVYVMGGSTVYGESVGDADTVPSRLQRLFDARGDDVRVVNLGARGATIADRARRFKDLHLEPCDVLVVYFGANETVFSTLESNVWNRRVKRFPRLERTIEVLRRKSHLGHVALGWLLADRPALAPDVLAAMERALRDIVSNATLRDAKVLAVLQPTIFDADAPGRPDIRRLAALWGTSLPVVLRSAYEVMSHWRINEISVIDARKAISGLDGARFTDWVHLDASGNELVARYLFGLLARI